MGFMIRHCLLFAGIVYWTFFPAPLLAQSVPWNQQQVTGPSPRYGHAMAYDAARGVTVLFGGNTSYPGTNGVNGETWEWDGTSWTQRNVSGPSPRFKHAMAYDSARGVTVLFGGRYFNGSYFYVGETWEWNGTAWARRLVDGPSPRDGHAMVYDATRGVAVLFGGGTNGGLSGETWEWDGNTWTQRTVSGPLPRQYHSMTWDAVRGQTVLFGGANTSSYYNETWLWNGAVWEQRQVSGPVGNTPYAMTNDSARGLAVLFGGFDSGANLSETWEWNGAAWSRRVVSGPSGRFQHAMAYDAARGVTVLFGGFNGVAPHMNGETWQLGVPCAGPSVTNPVAAQSLCSSGAVSLTVSGAGVGSLSFRWQVENAPAGSDEWLNVSDGPLVRSSALVGWATGAASNELAFQHNQANLDTLRFRCVVTNACRSAASQPAQISIATADVGQQGGVPGRDGAYDNNDFIIFIANFFSQLPAADRGATGGVPGPDGHFDNNDFIVFIDQFFAGC